MGFAIDAHALESVAFNRHILDRTAQQLSALSFEMRRKRLHISARLRCLPDRVPYPVRRREVIQGRAFGVLGDQRRGAASIQS